MQWPSETGYATPEHDLGLGGGKEETWGRVFWAGLPAWSHFILKLDMPMKIMQTYFLNSPMKERRPREFTKVKGPNVTQ